jgi:hypothetical protein
VSEELEPACPQAGAPDVVTPTGVRARRLHGTQLGVTLASLSR